MSWSQGGHFGLLVSALGKRDCWMIQGENRPCFKSTDPTRSRGMRVAFFPPNTGGFSSSHCTQTFSSFLVPRAGNRWQQLLTVASAESSEKTQLPQDSTLRTLRGSSPEVRVRSWRDPRNSILIISFPESQFWSFLFLFLEDGGAVLGFGLCSCSAHSLKWIHPSPMCTHTNTCSHA